MEYKKLIHEHLDMLQVLKEVKAWEDVEITEIEPAKEYPCVVSCIKFNRGPLVSFYYQYIYLSDFKDHG